MNQLTRNPRQLLNSEFVKPIDFEGFEAGLWKAVFGMVEFDKAYPLQLKDPKSLTTC